MEEVNLTTERFLNFELKYNDAVERIKKYQENEDIGVLVNWLLATDINPYSFLEDEDAKYLDGGAEDFAHICHLFHHAHVDDGEVSYIAVDGVPKIFFRYEIDQITRIKTELKKVNGEMKLVRETVQCEITHFKNFNQWIEAIEIFAYNDLKRCFMWDAKISGLKFAMEHYSKYKHYDINWSKEVK